jgi:hypothetical protein
LIHNKRDNRLLRFNIEVKDLVRAITINPNIAQQQSLHGYLWIDRNEYGCIGELQQFWPDRRHSLDYQVPRCGYFDCTWAIFGHPTRWTVTD